MLIPKKDRVWFWSWVAWKDHGSISGKRPPSAPQKIPQWAWIRYQLHIKRKPPVVIDPTPAIRISDFKNVMFCAQNPLGSGRAPKKYARALSADPFYSGVGTDAINYYSASVIDQLRSESSGLYAWHNPAQVDPAVAAEFKRRWGLDGIIGQFETEAEARISIAAGYECMIGSPSALTDLQMGVIRSGKIKIIVEDYWNTMPWLVQDFRNLPVASVCAGIYDASGESKYGRYVPLEDYIKTDRIPDGALSVYYSGGMREADWPYL